MGILITDSNYIVKNSNEFVEYINFRYTHTGQDISHLDSLYSEILKSSDVIEIWKLIYSYDSSNIIKQCRSISNVERVLLGMIMKTVRMNGCSPSELWLAILISGRVCGGISIDGNVETDVDVNGTGISMKMYSTPYTISLGAMPKKFILYFREFVQLSSIITGIDIGRTYARWAINEMLLELDALDVDAELAELVQLSDTHNGTVLSKLIEKLQILHSLDVGLLATFASNINSAIHEKIYSVEWWCFLIKDRFIMIDSDTIYNTLKMESNQIKKTIKNFHNFDLFVTLNKIMKDM